MLLQTELESVLEKLLCMTCAYTLHGGIQIYKPVKQVKKKKTNHTHHDTVRDSSSNKTKHNKAKQKRKKWDDIEATTNSLWWEDKITQ